MDYLIGPCTNNSWNNYLLYNRKCGKNAGVGITPVRQGTALCPFGGHGLDRRQFCVSLGSHGNGSPVLSCCLLLEQ